MKLYIVEFQYYDSHQDELVDDMWTMACRDQEEVDQLMDLNAGVFEQNGYKMKTYSSRGISETGNGYTIKLEKTIAK